MLKSVFHLKVDGGILAILPWSFLQADYSQDIRTFLAKNFKDIRVIAFNQSFFDGIQERVIFLYLSGKIENPISEPSIKIAYSFDHDSEINYVDYSISNWMTSKIVHAKEKKIESYFRELQVRHDFVQFKELFDISIGVVTGANSFFIRQHEEWKELELNDEQLFPILTKSKNLNEIDISAGHSYLLLMNKSNQIDNLVNEGIKKEIHKRSHSKNRGVWYEISDIKVPDAFFSYRVKEIPLLRYNEYRMTSTNSIHRLYSKFNLSSRQKMWLEVSSLSIYSQLSYLINAKTYGRGMVKLEPTGLKNSLINKLPKSKISGNHKRIINLLSQNKKKDAILLATEIVSSEFSIDPGITNKLYIFYKEISESRQR